ncbi:MAG: hypothetical protein PWP60_858 [Candidatus Atribacteria bacterium]|nr:hypothetical protein [Candidatus Atribacteria bacterium]
MSPLSWAASSHNIDELEVIESPDEGQKQGGYDYWPHDRENDIKEALVSTGAIDFRSFQKVRRDGLQASKVHEH